jgi:hypothetical protein
MRRLTVERRRSPLRWIVRWALAIAVVLAFAGDHAI